MSVINWNQWTQNEVHNIEIIGVETKLVSDILCYELTFIFLRHPYEKMKIYLYQEDIINLLKMLDIFYLSDLVGKKLRVMKQGDIKIGHKTNNEWV